jgi:hypothetical protein
MLGGSCLGAEGDSQTSKLSRNGRISGMYLLETSKTNCTARYVRYTANVNFAKGIRSIHYTIDDIEPQPAKGLGINVVWEASIDQIPTDSE